MPILDRFLEKIEFIPFHECWEWMSSKNEKGYGKFLVDREPEVGRVVHGLSANVGAVRGFGNAIVPQAAAEVIRSYMEIL